jgi:ubiquinone/menaquinone biosynthesis C-methylase UbiE
MGNQDSSDAGERKKSIAGVFHRASTTYGRVGPGVFAHFGRNLVRHAGLQLNSKVLDVACGRGAALFPAAQAVGPQGSVIGIDFAEGMVTATAREAADRGLVNVQVRRMDAEHLEFPDACFDAILCGFAIFFFPHPERALAEFRRVLRPGGRVAFSTWGNQFQREWEWFDQLVNKYLPPPSQEETQSEDQSFDTAEGMEKIMQTAGFTDVQVLSEIADFIYASNEEVWDSLWSHGARAQLESIEEARGPDVLEQFKNECLKLIDERKGSRDIQQPFHALYTLAVNP